ncbi:MAG: DUF933 domain-containing protein [Candidatus Aureabacteria bacterium]|nr:DUF933 domain-containing protein [Candidatus Auribacterota bacterium]
MKVAILGHSFAGQQQLFSILSGIPLESVRQKPLEAQPGVCAVRDPRVARLVPLYNPEKTVYATIDYTLLPDFDAEGPAKRLIFEELKKVDELCWVTRAGDAENDMRRFFAELIIADLLLVEKRLEDIAKNQKKKFSDAREKEQSLMELCRRPLEAEHCLARHAFTDAQRRELRAYQFLTLKPVITVINCAEGHTADAPELARLRDLSGIPAIRMNADLEEEISRLPEDERGEFMHGMGIEEPAVDRMTRIAFESLGYITFFTVGEDEVRAWAVRKNSPAVEAAEAVHTDIARGFIRVEVIKYADLVAAGSEAGVKEQGKWYLKGKEYVVEDGDVLCFRFSV